MMQRRAKIVCTIGPASIGKDILFSLIRGGMDVARLNFSHGDFLFHKRALDLVREGSRKFGVPVATLQDLQGIKIRTGAFEGGGVDLEPGEEVYIHAGEGVGRKGRIFISYPGLVRDSKEGDRILLDDGLMELRVAGKKRGALRTEVIEGGFLKDRKGVNLPGMRISARSFTEKDKKDLAFGLRMGVDYVAVSFVRTAEDIKAVKDYIRRKRHDVPVIAKIEKPEALDNIAAILAEADGLMVARGDLGVEVSPEEVPLIQKDLIGLANRAGKPVITATQMLESMTLHRRPTRAEATDVANAVLDGSDALMLSGETSAGSYPVLALRTMDKIIRKTEEGGRGVAPLSYVQGRSFSEAIAEAAARAAEDIGARYVVAFTQSGHTARLISAFRPSVPVVAFTPSVDISRRMSLYWGVSPMTTRPLRSTDELFKRVDEEMLNKRFVKRGEPLVITASTPIMGAGKTNLIKLHRTGEKRKG